MMDREELGKMKLEALRTLAAESGLEGANRLGKAELLDHLAPAPKLVERVEEAIVHAVAAVEHKAHELLERVRHPHAHSAEHDERPAPTVVAAPVAGEATAMEVVDADEAAPKSTAKPANGRAPTSATGAKSADGRAHHGSNGFGVPSATVHPQPQSPPPASEPIGMLDFEELPDHYGVDECEVLDKDPFWVFAYWEVTDRGLAAARAQLGQSADGARLVLRMFTTVPKPEGVERLLHDVELPGHHGRRYLQSPRPGAHLRVAVGLLSREGYFAPIAHSSLVRVPPTEPQPGPVEWMEVEPVKTRGRVREPIVIVRRGEEHAERGVKEVNAQLTTETPSAGTSPTATRPGQPGWPFSGSSSSSPSRGTR
jgi:hypothetical protein